MLAATLVIAVSRGTFRGDEFRRFFKRLNGYVNICVHQGFQNQHQNQAKRMAWKGSKRELLQS